MLIFCFWCIISTIWRSIPVSRFMVNTASVTISVIWSANFVGSFVLKAVRATFNKNSLSIFSGLYLHVSKNSKLFFFANSIPSTKCDTWIPSCTYRKLWTNNSPMNKTFEDDPSPTVSSWAVAARAIIWAVGWIMDISWRRTFPSLVILTCPAPPTNIFSVPFGPTLERITLESDVAAVKFIRRAPSRSRSSPFSFMKFTDDII